MSQVFGPDTALGLTGFTFADLHRPARLRELYLRFVEQVRRTEPELWTEWERYCEVPESLSNIARSNLIVAMAPHVSRFVSALFGVGADAEALASQTRAYDTLFRFKIDFVRRRALPLLKAGAPVEASAEDHALVEAALASIRLKPDTTEVVSAFRRIDMDDEMAIAAYGCSLLDREAADKTAAAAEIESLK